MDKKNNAYKVTVANSDTCQIEFDDMLGDQHLISTNNVSEWFDDDLVDVLGGLYIIDKFKLYELINKDADQALPAKKQVKIVLA